MMIPVYNCTNFLKEALKSVLCQNISENDMQIEVVDDASTDADVEALVYAVGKGRVKYYRQPQNVGSLRNFETCINRAQGKYVHILHGDDKVLKGYYNKIGTLFHQYPEAGAAFCRFNLVDETGQVLSVKKNEMDHDGVLQNWLVRISEKQRIQYAAITVKREVYERLGAFYATTYGEDWEMWVRIARYYPVAYTPEILAEYRFRLASITGTKFMTGENLKDIAQTIARIQDHLPPAKRKAVLKRSKRHYANYGVQIASQLWDKLHDETAVQAQIKQALSLHMSPLLYFKITLLYLKMLFRNI